MVRPCRFVGLFVCSLFVCGTACPVDAPTLLPAERSLPDVSQDLTLLLRIAQITDIHIVDEESPGRWPGAQIVTPAAWRPWESYSTQLFDGTIRAVNRIHASGQAIDFVLVTGDVCDNAQANELAWFKAIMDGQPVDPRSGPDDRPGDSIPPPEMDSHAPFQPQGLYRQGVLGPEPSIPWYVVVGNHDVYAIGVFPIITTVFGERIAPLPLDERPGLLLPTFLNPEGSLTYGPITPGSPGPPPLAQPPVLIPPNPARRFLTRPEFVAGLYETITGPRGHGFGGAAVGRTWYSVSPKPGWRLIGLDTSDHPQLLPGYPHHEGGISLRQRRFLEAELVAAEQRGEKVIVASHHPSESLGVTYAAAITGDHFRDLLGACSNVVLHVVGHRHQHRVADRGGYIEIETGSLMDPPQEARLIEVWHDNADGSLVISYETFSHLDVDLSALADDPLRPMRVHASRLAGMTGDLGRRQGIDDETEAGPHPGAGAIRLP